MLPGHPRILTCPFCGTEKLVMTLQSGNTFGMVMWSDNKQDAPMLPQVSFVQKCPHCGKYYIIERQEFKMTQEGWGGEQGLLTFDEVKEAFAQLSQEGFKDREEAIVRYMLHQAYNDKYCRSGEDVPIPDEDKALFRENARWLIENAIYEGVIRAEFYRQIGEFEAAKESLDYAEDRYKFLLQVAKTTREKIAAGDTRVFQIDLPE